MVHCLYLLCFMFTVKLNRDDSVPALYARNRSAHAQLIDDVIEPNAFWGNPIT